jgi:hypothetical protein
MNSPRLKNTGPNKALHPWKLIECFHDVLSFHLSHDLDLVPLTDFADKLPYSYCKIASQHGIAVIGDQKEVVLDLVLWLATLVICHVRQYKSAVSIMLPS